MEYEGINMESEDVSNHIFISKNHKESTRHVMIEYNSETSIEKKSVHYTKAAIEWLMATIQSMHYTKAAIE